MAYNERMFRTLALSFLLAVGLAAQPAVVTAAKAKIKAGDAEAGIAMMETALKGATAKDAPAIKTALAEAYFNVGDTAMNNEKLPPFRKYPAALKNFRKVLEFDRNHAKAKSNIATIEGIYKQMGRPVPQ